MICLFLLMLFLSGVLAACGGTTPVAVEISPPPPTAPSLSQTLPADPISEFCAGATAADARTKYKYEQIVPCLKTVERISEFILNNINYDVLYDEREFGGNQYVPSTMVYDRGIDDGDGHAILQCDLLEKNGFEAVMLGLSIDTTVGANICVVKVPEGLLALEGGGHISGPFKSLTELADFYTGIGWMQTGGTIRSLKASQVTQITTDNTSPGVMELPWIIQSY